jgi:hypothetical protein
MSKRPAPVIIPEGFAITKLPPGKATIKRRSKPSGAWSIRRAEATARRAEDNRYAKAIRRLAGHEAAKYEPRLIQHRGMWAVAIDIEIIKAGLTHAQARHFMDRARRFVGSENMRKERN